MIAGRGFLPNFCRPLSVVAFGHLAILATGVIPGSALARSRLHDGFAPYISLVQISRQRCAAKCSGRRRCGGCELPHACASSSVQSDADTIDRFRRRTHAPKFGKQLTALTIPAVIQKTVFPQRRHKGIPCFSAESGMPRPIQHSCPKGPRPLAQLRLKRRGDSRLCHAIGRGRSEF